MLRNFRDFFPLGQLGRGKLLALTLFSSPLFPSWVERGENALGIPACGGRTPFFWKLLRLAAKKKKKKDAIIAALFLPLSFSRRRGKKGWSSVGTARMYKEVLGETAEEGREIYAAAGDTRKGKKGIFGWKGGK